MSIITSHRLPTTSTVPQRLSNSHAGTATVVSRRARTSIVQTDPVPVRPAAVRPPCADGPDDWDLDVGTPESWRTAVQTCAECPLLSQCAELAQALIIRGDGPRAMIWAGVAYDGSGKVVENLDRHATAPSDHKRPLRIIHTGARPVCGEVAPETPRRRIVLGRRLRPVAGR
ncbi:MAG: hypothetical protein J2P18_15095 [Nocardia sp.]|nr:hypothetical protein [Nocardia sp.]